MNASLPTRLGPGLRSLLIVVGSLAVVVAANTLYLLLLRLVTLVTGQAPAASQVFQVLLLGHSAAGTLLVLLVAAFASMHLPQVWERRGRPSVGTGLTTIVLALALLVSGLFILTEAATREHRWVWWLHVAAAAAIPVVYVFHRKASVVRSAPSTVRAVSRGAASLLVLFGLVHVLVGESGREASRGSDAPAAVDYALERYGVVPPGYASPDSRFYPSPARTATGQYLPVSAILGPASPSQGEVGSAVDRDGALYRIAVGAESCVRCHADVAAQWEGSAHRFSSFNNPFYEAAVDLLRDDNRESNWWLEVHSQLLTTESTVGVIKSRWCAACHDPALLFTGAMDRTVDRRSTEAQAGLTCLSCHAIESVHDRTGNGNYTLRVGGGDPYVYAGVQAAGIRRLLHDAALRARPDAHREAMKPPVLGAPEFCSTCHKVSLREPVNSYRWLRGQNEFDAWENSGVSLENVSTFYLPARRRICQDCHMPPEPALLGDLAADSGTVRSHRFLAANTGLPFIRGDTSTVRRTEEFLREERLSVDIFRASTGARESAAGLEDRLPAVAGEELMFDIVVRNRGVGHNFPGGTVDSNEAWLEVRLVDDEGRTLLVSGSLGPDGRRMPGAHFYGALFVDSGGRPVDRRNPQDIRATVFGNVIGPGSADVAHYRVRLPESPGRYTLTARLLWRKFNRDYSVFTREAVPEAFPGAEEAPRLPVTVIAEDRVEIEAGDTTGDPVNPIMVSGGWERFNDFGIASLREGRSREALWAFAAVDSLAPERPDGPLNLARTRLEEGDIAGALAGLAEARRRDPESSTVTWMWARALQADGRYAEAAAEYRRVLAAFPRHRASLMGLGRTLYLDSRFGEALVTLDDLLEIDPEHRSAWNQRLLALRALGREAEARRAEAMVEYLRIDETAASLTRAIRLADPDVNRLSQPVRTYRLRPAVAE